MPALTALAVGAALLVAPTGAAAAPALPEVPDRAPTPLGQVEAFPRQTVLTEPADDPADASIPLSVVAYDDIAPLLNDLQSRSDRVSVEVAGTSTLGRDIYAVTVTAPETRQEARRQEAWKRKIQDDPTAAQADEALYAGYKTPLFVNGNIHGNEWEGTDASLRVIQDLATSDDPSVEELLRRNRLVFNVTSNPDGRVAGTRANAAGYDLNRDLTIVSQPETQVIRDLVIETQPIITLDLHGYVSPTLLHPSTPPHNVNNEYDLFIKHALPNALEIERDLAALGYAETQRARIPFRDDEPGVWDDFPPIYVPSFSLLQSSIPYTIEAPLNPRGSTLSPAERARRTAINTDVHEVAIRTSLDYVQENRRQVLFDQAEVFRRGLAGEPQRDIPDGFVPGWGPEDRYTTEFPRSYVIPSGDGQRSEPAAARLVDLLVDSGGRVRQAQADFTADGTRYAAGSWVVDLHQPKRGLVNSLLEPGADITDRVDDLYAGPAAWSQGLVWGATVDTLWDELPDVGTREVWDGVATGSLPGGRSDLRLDLQDRNDLLALDALLEAGVEAHQLADGSVVLPWTSQLRRLVNEPVRSLGVRFSAAPAGWTGERLRPLTVGYVGTVEERDTLLDLGFEARAVTPATLATTLTDDVDVLYVNATLDPARLTAENRAALDEFLARGGDVVGQGTPGAAFGNAAGLLGVRAGSGPGLASGIVNVVNGEGAVVGGALPHSFVAQPVWFTDLGTGVQVQQRYADDPLLSGWWAPNPDGTGGQDAAAGQASIVSAATSEGNGVVLIGTDPTFRTHPKGLQAQLGRALLWAATVETG